MLVVGAAGHRVLADVEKLSRSVNDVVDRLEHLAAGQPLVVLSALAQGADRLIADAMITRAKARLIAVLPFSPAEYQKDFSSAASKDELTRLLTLASETIVMAAGESRDAGYAKAGNYIVENCDVLVALWDGKPAQGAGGTADVVATARAVGLPVIWIKSGNRTAGTMNPTIIDKQGEVTYERFEL